MPQRLDTPTRTVGLSDPPDPSGNTRIGTTLAGRYQLLSRLGDGAMGSVYLAEHMALRRRVAVKILHAELSRLPEVVARFEREAVAAANIDHPNVAAASDFGSLEDGTFFLALEYVEGRCLRDEIVGALAPERAIHIGRQIAEALARAHELGIVHRDLKPENIMLVERAGDGDFVKVLDFGIARMRFGEDDNSGGKPALTRAGMVYGTPEYMAPEQALGLPVDARADLYALGVILFEMLTGVRPFEAENTVLLLGMQVTAKFPAFAERAPRVRVPKELEQTVYRLTAKSADDRFQTAEELVETLRALEMGEAVSPGSGRSQRRDERSSVRPGANAPVRTMFTASGEATDAKLLWSSVQRVLLRAFDELKPLIMALWAKVPDRYRTRRAAYIAGGSVGGVWLLLMVWVLWPSGRKDDDPSQGGDHAAQTDTETHAPLPFPEVLALARQGNLDEARQKVDEAQVTPAEEVELRQALTRRYFLSSRPIEAIRQLEWLYAQNIQATELPELAADIEKTLVDPATTDVMFGYVESHPNNLLADVLYKMVAEAQRPKAIRDRASKTLGKAFVRAHASPGVLIAYDLRVTGIACKAGELLERAKTEGDSRSLPYLYELQKPRMVKKGNFIRSKTFDMMACLHKDSTLDDTVTAIEQRTGTPHPKGD